MGKHAEAEDWLLYCIPHGPFLAMRKGVTQLKSSKLKCIIYPVFDFILNKLFELTNYYGGTVIKFKNVLPNI